MIRPAAPFSAVVLMQAVLALVMLVCAEGGVRAASCANVAYEHTGKYGEYSDAALRNPAICGAVVLLDWSAVEQVEGRLDFGPADAQVAAWAGAGKTFVLVLRFSNEYPRSCDKRQNLPQWEMSRIRYLCDPGTGSLIPDYFDPRFIEDWKTYVKSVADHFRTSPYRDRLLYVRAALGLGSESFLLRKCRPERPCTYDASIKQMQDWGYTPARWGAWQQNLLSFYAGAFDYGTVIYPLVALDVDSETGNPVQVDVARWAVEKGIGLGALGLRPGFGRGPAQVTRILTDARSRRPRVLIQLQTFRAVNDLSDLQEDGRIADELGAATVEWYGKDVAAPEYQEFFGRRINGPAPK